MKEIKTMYFFNPYSPVESQVLLASSTRGIGSIRVFGLEKKFACCRNLKRS